MSPELKQILKKTTVITLAECLVVSLACLLFVPHDSLASVLGGLFAGAAAAQAGLWMICRMANGLTPHEKSMKAKGAGGYALRYAFYALCLFGGVWAGLSLWGELGGFLCEKLSLVLYSLSGRKERQ